MGTRLGSGAIGFATLVLRKNPGFQQTPVSFWTQWGQYFNAFCGKKNNSYISCVKIWDCLMLQVLAFYVNGSHAFVKTARL